MGLLRNFAVLVSVCLAFTACGVTKELLPERPASSLPEFPVKPEQVEEPNTHIVKNEELRLSHSPESWNQNVMSLPTDAEKYARLVKRFKVPIQFNGWLMISNVSHSYQKCSGKLAEPEFRLLEREGAETVMVPDQKYHLSQKKLYFIKAMFENDALCSGVDIQFGVLFGE